MTAAFAATWFVSTEGLSFLAGWDTEGLGELPYGVVDGVVPLRVGGEDSFVVVFTRDGAWWGEVASRLYLDARHEVLPTSHGGTPVCKINPHLGLTDVLRLLRLLSRTCPLRPLYLGFLSHPEPS